MLKSKMKSNLDLLNEIRDELNLSKEISLPITKN